MSLLNFGILGMFSVLDKTPNEILINGYKKTFIQIEEITMKKIIKKILQVLSGALVIPQ